MDYTFLMTLGWIAATRFDVLPPGRRFLAPVEPADPNSEFRTYQKVVWGEVPRGADIETGQIREFEGWVWIEESGS